MEKNPSIGRNSYFYDNEDDERHSFLQSEMFEEVALVPVDAIKNDDSFSQINTNVPIFIFDAMHKCSVEAALISTLKLSCKYKFITNTSKREYCQALTNDTASVYVMSFNSSSHIVPECQLLQLFTKIIYSFKPSKVISVIVSASIPSHNHLCYISTCIDSSYLPTNISVVDVGVVLSGISAVITSCCEVRKIPSICFIGKARADLNSLPWLYIIEDASIAHGDALLLPNKLIVPGQITYRQYASIDSSNLYC